MQIDPFLPEQGYRLTIDPEGIRLVGGDPAGVYYGRRTLEQIAAISGERLPRLTIEDWPDIAVRGVMLDVSRDKVPTLETLKAVVERLASWKLNHLQLYMEHTFAYSAHRIVWKDADPYTASDLAELEAFCIRHHVELTVNQNCLGHMERWLKHDPYRPLALYPDGWVDGRGRRRPPMTLDPANPASLELVRGLLRELVPCSASGRVHVGLDEPFELPAEREDEYLAYVHELRDARELDDHEMLVWGDIVARHPQWLAELPEGVTVCDWGYEAGHAFSAMASRLAEEGVPFWTCPGTSSWNSLVGRLSNACENIRGAVGAAIEHGADGVLVTDWGDNGHLQYLPCSEPPLAYAGAACWCLERNRDIDLRDALRAHVLDDPSGELPAALTDLGDAHRLVKPQTPNMSILAMHLYYPQLRLGEGFSEGLSVDDLLEVERAIDGAVSRLARARSRRVDAELVGREVRTSATLLALACRDARARLEAGGRLEAVAPSIRSELAAELEGLIAAHRELWLARNRPGGLDDSAARLDRLLQAYKAP